MKMGGACKKIKQRGYQVSGEKRQVTRGECQEGLVKETKNAAFL